MKNKAIIILSLTILILMITTVSACEDNTTDTIGATDNIEICTVSIDESIGEISAPTLNAIDTSTKSTNEKRNINDSDTLLESNMNEDINKEYDDVEDYYGENNDVDKVMFTNSKNNPEILGISDNQEILCATTGAFSVSSASINQISVSVSVQFSAVEGKGKTYTVTASCNGYSSSFTATKTLELWDSQVVSGTITINGVFAPGQYTVTGTGGSSTATVSKATPSSITVTGGSSYTFGVDGSPVVYKGKVNGKKGSISMAGNVYIYQNAKLVKTVTCDANGEFTYTLDNSTCLIPSDYTYTYYYGGNTYYNSYGSADSLKASKTITVSKFAPDFTM